MLLVNSSQTGKEWPGCRQGFQNFFCVSAKTDEDWSFGLVPKIGDCALRPINVVGVQCGHVCLRSAEMPKQFIKRPVFRIAFAGDNLLMFIPGDGTFRLELYFRPLPFWNDRFRNPVHVEREIMQPSEKSIR